MLELFSCRNCIHNSGQSPNIGRGSGYCLQHNSVILEPQNTTCKYLKRKDLPHFVVDEGLREHAADFTLFPRMATLDTQQPIEQIRYSEEHCWESEQFDPLTHALAQYHKNSRKWVFIQAFTAGIDGRRSLAHASLVRHYMNQCGTWTSSYRLVLGMLEEIDSSPQFSARSLLIHDGTTADEVHEDAQWDVVFARLATLQEYGWHAGLERLMWVSDELNGSLSALDWPSLQKELEPLRQEWENLIIAHAKEHGVFFRQTEAEVDEEE